MSASKRKVKVITVVENSMIVKFPAWNYDIHVTLTSDVDLSTTRRQRYIDGCELMYSYAHGGCHIGHKGALESWVILPMDAPCSSVAHEAWHAIRHMMVSAGADLDSETVAYHLGYLVGQIIRFLIKNQKKQNDLRKKRREDKRRTKCHILSQVSKEEKKDVISTAARTPLQDGIGAGLMDNRTDAVKPITNG
jgi:hypothetical protein